MTGGARPQGRSELALAALHTGAHMPGEVLLQFQRNASNGEKARALGRIGAMRQEIVVPGAWRRVSGF